MNRHRCFVEIGLFETAIKLLPRTAPLTTCVPPGDQDNREERCHPREPANGQPAVPESNLQAQLYPGGGQGRDVVDMSIMRDDISISLGAGARRQSGAGGHSAATDTDSQAGGQFPAGSPAVRFSNVDSAWNASGGC